MYQTGNSLTVVRKTKHQLVDELTARMQASGEVIVFWEEGSQICVGVVVVEDRQTKRILTKSALGSFRILQHYSYKVPSLVTCEEVEQILNEFPQLVSDYEMHAALPSGMTPKIARVERFCSFGQRERVKVIANGTELWCEAADLKAVPLVKKTEIEQDDDKQQDTEAEYQQQHCPVSETVLKFLNHHPFVWWKTESGWNVCGHIVEQTESTAIVRTMLGTYHQIDTAHLSDGSFPEDINAQQIEQFVQNLPTLLIDFQTRVRVPHSSFWSSWNEIQIVEGFSLRRDTITVYTKEKPRGLTVTADDLIDVPVGGATAIANDAAKDVAKLNTKLQTVSAELQQKTAKLTNERAEKERTMDELAARERELKDALRKTKTTAQQLRQEKSSSATKSDDINRLTRSLSEKKRELSRKTGDLKRERDQSARKSTDLARKNSEISELKRQVKQLERNVSAREETIAEYGNRFSEMKREQGELRLEVTNKNAEIKQLNKNIDAYEGVEEELTEVRKKNKELYREKAALRSQLGDYNDEFALDNPINSINFVSKLENLRDQEHAFACDVLIEEMGWDVKDAYHLLFEVFMFSYEYFENRMNNIRSLLNMDGDSALSALFSGRLQSNYAKLLDKKGLEERFVVEFEEKLGHNVEHRDMKKYLGACGELCWVAVLRTVPAQVYFYPRSNEINADELELFDSSRFVDYDQLNGERFVVQYILPGVSRVDSDRPLGLPLVLTEGRDDEKSDSNEEEAGLPVDEMRSELAPIEDAMWQSKRRRTRKLFGQMKIDPENCDLVIGCAVDGCDFIHASSFAEFLSTIDRHRLCCREDEDHIGVKILKLVPHEE